MVQGRETPRWSGSRGDGDPAEAAVSVQLQSRPFPGSRRLGREKPAFLSLSPLTSFYRPLCSSPTQAPAAFCLWQSLAGTQTDEQTVIRYGQENLQTTSLGSSLFFFYGLYDHDCDFITHAHDIALFPTVILLPGSQDRSHCY